MVIKILLIIISNLRSPECWDLGLGPLPHAHPRRAEEDDLMCDRPCCSGYDLSVYYDMKPHKFRAKILAKSCHDEFVLVMVMASSNPNRLTLLIL